MNYCQNCILPDTRPNLTLNARGICTACEHTLENPTIDWNQRKHDFEKLVASVKSKNRDWDCVIPVSGGKDSTWQVIVALEHGLKPLCVTWKTPARNSLGQKNLDNLVKLGVDHFDLTINPKVEKKFTLKALEVKGSVAIPMHMALFSLPLQTAVRYKIPLVLWGENSAIEYGGTDPKVLGFEMNREWLLKYGVTNGTVSDDWVDNDLSKRDMAIYAWPSEAELKEAGVTASFLGWYLPWDPTETFKVAKEYGFQASEDKPKTGLYKFADLDDEFLIPVHHWVKWYKFGFTRLWDNLSLEIRHGRMTRVQAIELVKQAGSEKSSAEIEKFCSWAGITTSRFYEIVEPFRNNSIWEKTNGQWQIRNFLIPDWKW